MIKIKSLEEATTFLSSNIDRFYENGIPNLKYFHRDITKFFYNKQKYNLKDQSFQSSLNFLSNYSLLPFIEIFPYY
ncbi:MAG: hypothetical protein QXJ28_01775 [Candidatus Pacearchaeota archaeon]